MERDEDKNVSGVEQPNETDSDSLHDTAEKDPDAAELDEYGEPLNGEPHVHPRKRPLYKRPAFLVGAGVVLLVLVIVGLRYWLYARSHESTDDAFVDGNIVQVSPKVIGYVTKIYVKSNQDVKAGDLLLEIDPRDYEAKVAQAKAALNAGLAQQKQAQTQVTLTRVTGRANVQQAAAGVQQARSGVAGARAGAASERSRTNQASAGIGAATANVQQAQAQVSAAMAEAARANADVLRYQMLYDKDEISRQRLDQAIAAARTANAQVDAARQRVATAEAQVNEARAATSAAAQNAQRARTQISGARHR